MFHQISDLTYGNCFTFNGNNSLDMPRRAVMAGPHHGLSLLVFVDQAQYIEGLVQSAGIRLLVHRQDHIPFMEDGWEIGVGQKAGIKTKVVSYS